jgi:hypothetical protein
MLELIVTASRVIALVNEVELSYEPILQVVKNPTHVEVFKPPSDRIHDEFNGENVAWKPFSQVEILQFHGYFLAFVSDSCVNLS